CTVQHSRRPWERQFPHWHLATCAHQIPHTGKFNAVYGHNRPSRQKTKPPASIRSISSFQSIRAAPNRLNSFLPQYLLHGVELVDAALVPTSFVGGAEPGIDDFQDLLLADHSLAEGNYVGVVM